MMDESTSPQRDSYPHLSKHPPSLTQIPEVQEVPASKPKHHPEDDKEEGVPTIKVTRASPITEESSGESIPSNNLLPASHPELLTPREAENKDSKLNVGKRVVIPRQNSGTSDQLNMFEKLASLEDLGASVDY